MNGEKMLTIVTSGMDGLHTGKCVEFRVGSFGSSKEEAIQRVQTSVLINSLVMLSLEAERVITGYHKRLLPYAKRVVKNRDNLDSIFVYRDI